MMWIKIVLFIYMCVYIDRQTDTAMKNKYMGKEKDGWMDG